MNLWEDATHQITFDDGRNWTNVILGDGYYVACSDGKRAWPVSDISNHLVVARPVGTDVPRTLNGWPAITPREMTDEQVRREANRWRKTAISTDYCSVGNHEWRKYAGEYVRRGLATISQLRDYEELQCCHLWVGWDRIEVCELCEETREIPPDPEDQVSKRTWLDAIKWWKQ